MWILHYLKIIKLKNFVFPLFIIVLSSCRRENDPIPPATTSTFQSFIGKYLIMDSIRTTVNGISTLTIVGTGKGGDMVYSSNGTYQIYQQPPLIKNYKYQEPDIIYYWSIGSTMQTTVYTKILSVNNNHIVSTDTEMSTTKKTVYYQTAE
jgi:hypothetical protein